MIFLKKRILIIVTLLFIPLYIFSQTSVDYNKLEETIINHKISEVERWKLIYNYINIAKKGQNDEAIINSYKIASVYSIFPENLKYADSALIISKKLNAPKFLAISYLNRGIISMDNSENQVQNSYQSFLFYVSSYSPKDKISHYLALLQ